MNLIKTMREKRIVPHSRAGFYLQRHRDQKRIQWYPAFASAKRQGHEVSFFKDYLVISFRRAEPHVLIFDLNTGKAKILKSIGAAMGFMQGTLFDKGHLT